jgi:hypothetical protein
MSKTWHVLRFQFQTILFKIEYSEGEIAFLVCIMLDIRIATRMKYWLWTEDVATEKLVELWE